MRCYKKPLANLVERKDWASSIGVTFASHDPFLVWRYLGENNFAEKEAYLNGEEIQTLLNPSLKEVCRLRCSIFPNGACLLF